MRKNRKNKIIEYDHTEKLPKDALVAGFLVDGMRCKGLISLGDKVSHVLFYDDNNLGVVKMWDNYTINDLLEED